MEVNEDKKSKDVTCGYSIHLGNFYNNIDYYLRAEEKESAKYSKN